MTHQEIDQIVAALVTQLSTQGVENPLAFAAIERTGRTSSGLLPLCCSRERVPPPPSWHLS